MQVEPAKGVPAENALEVHFAWHSSREQDELVVAQLGKCLKAIAEDMGYTYTPPVPTVSPASSLKSSLVGVVTAFAVVFAALL